MLSFGDNFYLNIIKHLLEALWEQDSMNMRNWKHKQCITCKLCSVLSFWSVVSNWPPEMDCCLWKKLVTNIFKSHGVNWIMKSEHHVPEPHPLSWYLQFTLLPPFSRQRPVWCCFFHSFEWTFHVYLVFCHPPSFPVYSVFEDWLKPQKITSLHIVFEDALI